MADIIIPMGPARANITGVRAGDRNLMTVTLTQNTTPLNLTGLDITAQARKKSVDPTVAVSAVVTIDDAAAGKLSVRWPGPAITEMLAGKATWAGVWDLQYKRDDDDPVTLVAGTFAAEMDVTRASS